MSNDDDKTRKDLTRLEDLSEFLHVDDSEVDDKFEGLNHFTAGDSSSEDNTSLTDLDELPPDLPIENVSEDLFSQDEESDEVSDAENSEFNLANENESTSEELEEISFSENETTDENSFSTEFDSNFSEEEDASQINEAVIDNLIEMPEGNFEEQENLNEFQDELQVEIPDDIQDDITNDQNPPSENLPEIFETQHFQQEKFEDIKEFSTSFSYGQILGTGNPPFSLILRNIKYSEDAEDILIILKEFGIVTEQNSKDMLRSLELGALLVSQISEYCAIILAHKFRRFDCDIEVGLSDEIHPSKSGETNPKGLVKKESLHQNKSESSKLNLKVQNINDIIVSTNSVLEGYSIKKYLGVQTSFVIVDEAELLRLKFIQQSIRSLDQIEKETLEVYKDFQVSFDFLFNDLCDQLKSKAFHLEANALLGLNYQISPASIQSGSEGSCFQIICSATLALIEVN